MNRPEANLKLVPAVERATRILDLVARTRTYPTLSELSRELGIATLRLDTNSALPEAAALYRKTGWREIPRFNDDPYPDLFFEKTL